MSLSQQGSGQSRACPACGSPVEPGAHFCPECGNSLAPPDPFAAAEAAREDLSRQRAGGQIGEDEYLRQASGFTVEDARGSWRLVPGSGLWMWYNGSSWIARDPHADEKPILQGSGFPAPPASPPPKRRRWLTCLLVSAIAGLLLCGCGGIALWRDYSGGSEDDRNGVARTAASSEAVRVIDTATLSVDQRGVVEEFGWPHSFTVADLSDSDGSTVRFETWQYLDAGVAYSFSEGRFLNWETIDAVPDGLIAAPYRPNLFALGQTSEEVRGAIEPDDWEQLEGMEVLLEGVETYAADQLLLTFRDDRLIMIDAVAISGGS